MTAPDMSLSLGGSPAMLDEEETWGSRRPPITAFRKALADAKDRSYARQEHKLSESIANSALWPSAGPVLYQESLRSLVVARQECNSMQLAEESLQAAVLALEAGQGARERASDLAIEAERAFCKASKLSELLRDGAISAKHAAATGQSTMLCEALEATANVTNKAATSMEAETAFLDKRSSAASLRASLKKEKENELELAVKVEREKLKIARHQALCNSSEAFSAFVVAVSSAYEEEDASGGSNNLDSVVVAITQGMIAALRTAANSAAKF